MKTLIVGIGSVIRGDDGVGVHLARRLEQQHLPEDTHIVTLGTAGLTLLDVVAGYDRLIVLDAMVSGAPAGTIHVLTGGEVARAAHLGMGHEADLPTTLALGCRLAGSSMPSEIFVVAIEACDLNSFSEHLTAPVAAAIPAALGRVEQLITHRGSNL